MPIIVTRLLSVWYSTQRFAVKWNSVVSDFFYVTNGVRQGGILSPILFNIYIDNLSCRLNNSGIGCHINGKCMNHIIYADDSVILAPSPMALQRLLNICSQYAKEFDIIYNAKKSCVMSFMPNRLNLYVPSFSLDGVLLQVVTEQKYLGVFIRNDCNDVVDIKRQSRAIYARGNMLVRKFRHCNDAVKVQLFKSYCTPLYGAPLWKCFTKSAIQNVKTAYNNCFRYLLGIKREGSISAKFVGLNVVGFDALRRRLIFSLMKRLQDSKNTIVNVLMNCHFFNNHSIMYKKWKALLC